MPSLNIKDEEAHRLAGELAQLTGESLTFAVKTSIKERLDRSVRPASGRGAWSGCGSLQLGLPH